jgi:hypothetical protein
MGPFLKVTASVMAMLLMHMAPPAYAQEPETVSNSLAAHYKGTFPALSYVYVNDTQTHDYSGNWDLDADGVPDRICFIGTGGAHLYYYLHVTLSSDNSPLDFPFIQTDAPVLVPIDTLFSGYAPIGFSVTQPKDGPPQVVVRLDQSTRAANRRQLQRLKLDSEKIAVSFLNGKARFAGL